MTQQISHTCGGCHHAFATTIPTMAGMVHCGKNVGGRSIGFSAAGFFFSRDKAACGEWQVRTTPLPMLAIAAAEAPETTVVASDPAPEHQLQEAKREDELFPADTFL